MIEIDQLSKRYDLRSHWMSDATVGNEPHLEDDDDPEERDDHPRDVHTVSDGWALRQVSVTIGPGERVGIIGGNGSGKSTLLRIVAGVAVPSQGCVRGIGRVVLVNSYLRPFSPTMSAWRNLCVTANLLQFDIDRLKERLPQIVEFASISDRLHENAGAYSKAMYSRLAIAALLHMDPAAILIDDALGLGDERFRTRVNARLNDILDGGAALLLASHKLSLLKDMCRRCIWLDNGEVKRDGQVREVIAQYLDRGPTDSREVDVESLASDDQAEFLDGEFENEIGEDQPWGPVDIQSPLPLFLKGRPGELGVLRAIRLANGKGAQSDRLARDDMLSCTVIVETFAKDVSVDVQLAVMNRNLKLGFITRPEAPFLLTETRQAELACQLPVRDLVDTRYVVQASVAFAAAGRMEFDTRRFTINIEPNVGEALRRRRFEHRWPPKQMPVSLVASPWSVRLSDGPGAATANDRG